MKLITKYARHLRMGVYIILTAALLGWHLYEQSAGFGAKCTLTTETTPESYNFLSLYHTELSLRKNPATDSVRAVNISADLSFVQNNVCPARGFMADLLSAIAAQSPQLVAIDKVYADSCAKNDADSTRLNTALSSYSAQFPIVIAAGTEKAANAAGDRCLEPAPKASFITAGIIYGLSRLNADVLKIPIWWPLIQHDQPAKLPDAKDNAPKEENLTFAYQAAVHAADLRHIATLSSSLDLLRHDNLQPYAELSDPVQEIRAGDLLCSAANGQSARDALQTAYNLDCSKAHPVQANSLRDKLIVVGAESEHDTQTVLEETIPGFQLQARYIEALLSGNYLREFPWWFPLLLYCLYFFGAEVVIHMVKSEGLARIIGIATFVTVMLLGLASPLIHRFPPISALAAIATSFLTIFFLEFREKSAPVEKHHEHAITKEE